MAKSFHKIKFNRKYSTTDQLIKNADLIPPGQREKDHNWGHSNNQNIYYPSQQKISNISNNDTRKGLQNIFVNKIKSQLKNIQKSNIKIHAGIAKNSRI